MIVNSVLLPSIKQTKQALQINKYFQNNILCIAYTSYLMVFYYLYLHLYVLYFQKAVFVHVLARFLHTFDQYVVFEHFETLRKAYFLPH